VEPVSGSAIAIQPAGLENADQQIVNASCYTILLQGCTAVLTLSPSFQKFTYILQS